MKVKELIEELNKYDPDTEVFHYKYGEAGEAGLQDIEFRIHSRGIIIQGVWEE